MIYDKLVNLPRYKGMSKNLDTAIDFLLTHDLNQLVQGRNEVDGDEVFINHFGYVTAPKTAASMFEDHVQYLDVHLLHSGKEKFLLAPANTLTEVESRLAEDVVLYLGDAQVALPMTTEDFCIVFPGEAHLPKIADGEPCEVSKSVVKIRI